MGQWVSGDNGPNTLRTVGVGDTLDGGQGNDLYIITHIKASIVEAPNGGLDTLQASVDFALQDNVSVEVLIVRGTGPLRLAGNNLSNTLMGNGAENWLSGMAGNDVLYGDNAADVLSGGTGADRLYGGQDADTLSGGSNNDTLFGDVGDDLLKGDDGSDILYGGTDHDKLFGGAGNDVMYGDAGNDHLKGDAGTDRLYGGAGDNLLWGHSGNDTLHGGPNDDRLYGGDNDDALFGATGNDVLRGSLGNDRIATGQGYDTVVFDTKPSARTNVDTVTDFNPWTDHISLSLAAFDDLSGRGRLQESAFRTGTKAADASDRLIFDPSRGMLYFDPDGTGAAAQIAMAHFLGDISLSHSAFVVV